MKRKNKAGRKAGKTMQSVVKHTGGVVLARGEWERNRPAHLASLSEKHTSTKKRKGFGKDVMNETAHAIAIRHSEGATVRELAEEFGLSFSGLRAIINHKFVNRKEGVEALRSLLLENALQLGAQTRQKAASMNGMQSAVATGIMVSKFIELDKHQEGRGNEIDMEAISEIGRELKDLNKIVKDSGVDRGAELDDIDDDDEDDD